MRDINLLDSRFAATENFGGIVKKKKRFIAALKDNHVFMSVYAVF